MSMQIPPIPPWMNDEPGILKLLGAVLDRLDQQPGDTRQRNLTFGVEKQLPLLGRLDGGADQIWHFLRHLETLGVCAIRAGRRGPYDAEWRNARLAFPPECEATLRDWLDRPREESAIRAWRAEVEAQASAFPGGIESLSRRRLAVPGHGDAEAVAALARLGSLDRPLTLRQMSALIFRGDSKRLDDREDLVRALFPNLRIKPRPLVLAVHLPEDCRGVLFIENQDSYASAVAGDYSAARDLALIYAAGFRSGAERVRDRGAVLPHYSGAIVRLEAFEVWWFENAAPPGPLHFFGDLDFSGMGILAALRERFGDVTAWRPGYEALLERLRAGSGHAPDAADKERQIDPGRTGCDYADTVLLPAARELGFIDQEALSSIVDLSRQNQHGSLNRSW